MTKTGTRTQLDKGMNNDIQIKIEREQNGKDKVNDFRNYFGSIWSGQLGFG
jgi:hypothetical protein